MTAATIQTAILAILEAQGAQNVHGEEPYSTDPDEGLVERQDAEDIHFWRVRMSQGTPTGGAGYTELRHVARIEGFLSVQEGQASPERAAALQAAVVAALAAPDVAFDVEAVTPDPGIPVVQAPAGYGLYPCHRMGTTLIALELAP